MGDPTKERFTCYEHEILDSAAFVSLSWIERAIALEHIRAIKGANNVGLFSQAEAGQLKPGKARRPSGMGASSYYRARLAIEARGFFRYQHQANGQSDLVYWIEDWRRWEPTPTLPMVNRVCRSKAKKEVADPTHSEQGTPTHHEQGGIPTMNRVHPQTLPTVGKHKNTLEYKNTPPIPETAGGGGLPLPEKIENFLARLESLTCSSGEKRLLLNSQIAVWDRAGEIGAETVGTILERINADVA